MEKIYYLSIMGHEQEIALENLKEMIVVFPDLDLKYDREVKIDELFGANPQENKVIARLLIFGLIVDGTLSVKERLTIRKIAKEDWFPVSMDELENILKGYVNGEGLKRF